MANPTSKPFYGWPSSYAVSSSTINIYAKLGTNMPWYTWKRLVQEKIGYQYFLSSYGKRQTILNLFEGL